MKETLCRESRAIEVMQQIPEKVSFPGETLIVNVDDHNKVFEKTLRTFAFIFREFSLFPRVLQE